MPVFDGNGGARKRVHPVKPTVSLGMPVPSSSKFVRSSGVALYMQFAGGFARSFGKSSLLTPISTL